MWRRTAVADRWPADPARRHRELRVRLLAIVALAASVAVACGDSSGGTAASERSSQDESPSLPQPDPNANQYPLIEQPMFEFEEIAEAPFSVVAPTQLPSSFRLLEAGYLTSEQRELNEDDCGKVVLFYADPALMASYDETQIHPPYIQLDMVDAECTTDDVRDAEAKAEKGAGSANPLDLGEHRGTIARFQHPSTGPGFIVQLKVSGTDVFIDSTLSEDELLSMLGTLVPFDPSQPVPTTTR